MAKMASQLETGMIQRMLFLLNIRVCLFYVTLYALLQELLFKPNDAVYNCNVSKSSQQTGFRIRYWTAHHVQ